MTLRVTYELFSGRDWIVEYGCSAKDIKKIKKVELLYDNVKPKLAYKPHKTNIKGEQ